MTDSALSHSHPLPPLASVSSSWLLGGLVPDFLGAPDTHCFPVSHTHLPPLRQEPSARCRSFALILAGCLPLPQGGNLPTQTWVKRMATTALPLDHAGRWVISSSHCPPQGSPAASSTSPGRGTLSSSLAAYTCFSSQTREPGAPRPGADSLPLAGQVNNAVRFCCSALFWEESSFLPDTHCLRAGAVRAVV